MSFTKEAVAERLAAHHSGALTEKEIFCDMLLDEVQAMLDGGLEGHYWVVTWGEPDEKIIVHEVDNQPIDQIIPLGASFSNDFYEDGPKLFRYLDTRLKKIIASH